MLGWSLPSLRLLTSTEWIHAVAYFSEYSRGTRCFSAKERTMNQRNADERLTEAPSTGW